MNTIAERIRFVMATRGITDADVIKATSIPYTTWRDISLGVTRRPQKLPEIATALGVSFQWLCFGEGYMEPNMIGIPAPTSVKEPAAVYGDGRVLVPRIVGAHLAAGDGEIVYDLDTVKDRSFDSEWMREEGLDASHCVLWTVRGDSMHPTISHSDMVLINQREREPMDRQIFALITEDGLRLKRLHKKLDKTWEVRSDNEDKRLYPTEPFVPGTIAIMGRARWHARNLRTSNHF